ncbi:MAG: HTH domain-containing protein [Lacipirellulaceae bacterium]
MGKARELTWRQAIEQVLQASDEPLHVQEVVTSIRERRLRENFGATPYATVTSHLHTALKSTSTRCPWEKVGKATFRWRSSGMPLSSEPSVQNVPIDDSDSESSIVTSFGMFWRRDHVRWANRPSLLGMQQIGAESVNFSDQLGVYLLYDGREAVYVGRATERPLGVRLFEHTRDRLGSRWDRVSWFGVRPVAEDGSLGTVPATYKAPDLLPVLEAVLIEALEPRQNRKRGDDLGAVEYLQVLDESIRNSQAIETMITAIQSK